MCAILLRFRAVRAQIHSAQILPEHFEEKCMCSCEYFLFMHTRHSTKITFHSTLPNPELDLIHLVPLNANITYHLSPVSRDMDELHLCYGDS